MKFINTEFSDFIFPSEIFLQFKQIPVLSSIYQNPSLSLSIAVIMGVLVHRKSSVGSANPNYPGRGVLPRNPNFYNSHQPHASSGSKPNKWERSINGKSVDGTSRGGEITPEPCHFWVQGNCKYGDKCRYLHSWFTSTDSSLTMLKQLEGGHDKAITAINLPSESDKLFSTSKDETVRVWDYNTGQSSAPVKLEGPVGCIRSERPWIFFGIPNAVKGWNSETNTFISLDGPVGQVYALAVAGTEFLYSGNQDGNICVWKYNATASCFEPNACFKGHSLGVTSLAVGGTTRLYSGSMDNTIKIWDLETGKCLQTLTGHTSAVTSLFCWEYFLISGSLDKTVKVWQMGESGSVEVRYTHKEEHGVITIGLMHDAQGKSVLMCSCNNNTLSLYDLPSFNLRGRIFSKEDIRAIGIGPQGLFFTGSEAGELKVWNCSKTTSETITPAA
ncbi:hypothetical protein ACHQM5_009959 [Ranunculus cassubicifolius]